MTTRAAALTILAATVVAVPSLQAQTSTGGARGAGAAAKAAAEAQREAERERRVTQAYGRDDRRAEQTETITRTVRLGANGEIDLHNMSGTVTVTRGGGSEATIEAIKKARAATDDAAREMLQLVRVEITERAGRVEVRPRYPHFEHDGRGRRPELRNVHVGITFNITAPANTRLRINTMSGGINVSDITGELSLEAMSGSIKIERAARIIGAKAMSGNVSIIDAKSDGVIDAGTMSGTVTLKQVKARRLSVGAVSGTVSLADIDCERLDAQTTSGTILYEGPLSRNGRYKFAAHSGNVKLALTGDTGFEIDATSWNGGIRSELNLKNQEMDPPDPRRRGPAPRTRTLRASYGDGSAVLDINTFSGSIILTRAADRR